MGKGSLSSRACRAALAAVLALGVTAPAAGAAFGVAAFNAEARKSSNPGDLETQAGAHPFEGVTDFTFNTNGLGMPDGNVKNIRVDLPPGLISNPEATPKCAEEQFPDCPPATKLGTETLTAGTAFSPPVTVDVFNMVPKKGQVSLFAFNAPVFGRTDIVGGVRSPGDLGLYFTISGVPQNSNLVRSILTFYGVPADRNGGGGPKTPFITLPTGCVPPQTTTLTVESYAGEKAEFKSVTPTGTTGCENLPFAPEITATASGVTSKDIGAGLRVTVSQGPEQANIRKTSVHLPKEFAARGTTLALVCPEAAFKAGPETCPAGSQVGTGRAETPLLPTALAGNAYLVGHGANLPTLEVVLKAPVFTVNLSGSIDLTPGGIISSFNTVPDMPISNFTLDLPTGPHSALATSADLCAADLSVPATFVAHSGRTVEKTFPLTVTDCRFAVKSAKVRRTVATLTLRAPGAGKVTVSGSGLRKNGRTVAGRSITTVKVGLSRVGRAKLKKARRTNRKLVLRATARFTPSGGGTAEVKRKRLVFK